jgi:hypothetical protein
MVGKHTSTTITGRETQQRSRAIKNTFQTLQTQAAEQQKAGSPVKEELPEYRGAVGPKLEVAVPKNLVLFQLSKHVDASLLEGSAPTGAPTQASRGSRGGAGSFLDHVEGARAKELGRNGDSVLEAHPAAHSLRTVEPRRGSVIDPTPNANQQHASLFEPSQASLRQSLQQSALQTPRPALSNFHITDLLERSLLLGSAQPKEQAKLRQVVELYKRQVKADRDIGNRSQVIIRNYRLHVVTDAARELHPEARRLYTLNQGTTIHVSNSILRPEIHKYATRVTGALAQAWPELLEEATALPGRQGSPTKVGAFQRRSQSVTPAAQPSHTLDAFLQSQPEDPAQEAALLLQQELASLQAEDRQMARLEREKEEERKNLASGMSGASASRGSALQAEAEPAAHSEGRADDEMASSAAAELDDGLSSRPFTAADLVELEAIKETNKIFDRWLRSIMSQASELPAAPRRPRLQNGQPAAPRIRDINWRIALDNANVVKEKPVPLERLTTRSFYDGAPYRHLQMLVINQDIREWYSRFVLKTQTVRSYSQIVQQDL